MPRERQEFFRESNSKEKESIYILAFEGNVTEVEYFEEIKSYQRFNDELVHLHLLKRRKSDTNSSPKYVFSKLKREAKEEYNFNDQDELWMIIDTDRWKNIREIINLCSSEGNMFAAVSNPCFEFWLLLHVKKFSDLLDEEKTNLLQNRKISNKRRYIDKFLGDAMPDGYNKRNPRTARFILLVDHAITESRNLVVEGEDYPKGLGSHVYKIVEKLIK